ncbi:hypothetical protein BGZ46_009329 [Entomortierella lignicola]|nr:hypothetical protein BGZ46_009329 [Entomortierella lignicola]
MTPNITVSSSDLKDDLVLVLQHSSLQDEDSFDHEYYLDEIEQDFPLYDIDAYYDYDDIHLDLPAQHKSKQSRSKKKKRESKKSSPIPSLKKIVQLVIDCPRPLVFPLEVLGLVCSHLSQSTLRACVSLVCKDWNAVSDQYIRRTGVWAAQSEDYQTRILEQMKRLDTLECWFNVNPFGCPLVSSEETRRYWTTFREAILAPFNSKLNNQDINEPNLAAGHHLIARHQNEDRPTCLLHNIRHLSFRGKYMAFSGMIWELHKRQGLRFLKICSLDTDYGGGNFLLFPFLDDCPNLIELTLRIRIYTSVKILMGDEDDLAFDGLTQLVNPETAHLSVEPKAIPPPKTYQQKYNLRIFDVERYVIDQTVLERVASTCPKLRVLKAKNINLRRRRGSVQYNDHEINHDRLIKHVKAMCQNFEWYSVTLLHESSEGALQIERKKTYFPELKYLSLSNLGYRFLVPEALVSKSTFAQITVLEMTPSDDNDYPSFIMNKVLCQSPNLLHLIAPEICFLPHYLYYPQEPVSSIPKLFIESNRVRKRQERSKRRRQRQVALLRFHNPSSLNTTTNAESTPPFDHKTWQCRDLRSFDMQLANSIDFIAYIEANQLFEKLSDLRVSFPTLKVGQLVNFPHDIARLEKSGAKPGFSKPEPSKRHENVLLQLRGMKSLENLHITVKQTSGLIRASDFEFLRKKTDVSMMHTNSLGTSEGLGVESANINLIDGNEDASYEQPLRGDPKMTSEIFWPQLHVFHIRYHSSPYDCSYHKLVSKVEGIRPGIEFSMKKMLIKVGWDF